MPTPPSHSPAAGQGPAASAASNLNRLLSRLESVFSVAAAIILFAIMAIVASDVVKRYAFNEPYSWSYDLVSLYLELALFYFALSRTFATHAHVGVDILHYYATARTRRILEIVTCVVSIPLFAFIAYAGAIRAWSSFAGGDVLAGLIAWPTWISIALVPLGAGLLTLRLAVGALAHLASLATGEEVIPLPPLARSSAGTDGAFE